MNVEFTGRRKAVAAARVAFEANVDGKEVLQRVSGRSGRSLWQCRHVVA